jgi:hypothetical protein
MLNPRIHFIPIAANTLNASGIVASELHNLARGLNPLVVLHASIGSPQGTTPSLTLTVNGSLDNANWYQLGTITITAAGNNRLPLHDVLEPYLQIEATVSNGASFPVNELSLLMTPPDA